MTRVSGGEFQADDEVIKNALAGAEPVGAGLPAMKAAQFNIDVG
jgi:hypothetical protein